jgi:hypothetical protein
VLYHLSYSAGPRSTSFLALLPSSLISEELREAPLRINRTWLLVEVQASKASATPELDFQPAELRKHPRCSGHGAKECVCDQLVTIERNLTFGGFNFVSYKMRS